MRALATWCYRRRRLVLAIWIAALIATTVVSKTVGANYSNSFTLPDTESTKALSLLKAVAPRQSGDTEQIVVATAPGHTITDTAVRARIEAMLAKVAALPHVSDVVSPYDQAGSAQVSADRTVGFAMVTMDIQEQDVSVDVAKQFVNTAKSGATADVQVAVAGQLAARAGQQGIGGTGIGILAAAVVLFLVFGSLLAMLLPIITALVSLSVAIAVVSMLTHVIKMPQFSDQLILLIGLGVGIDYALFIVSRYRQGLLSGHDAESATVTAVDTSGRAVLFAGIIVCIALLGMFALRVSFLYGLAVAASIGVLFTMVASLTLLPALLGFFGTHVLRRKERKGHAEGAVHHGQGRFWTTWTGIIARRPFVVLAGSLAIMVVLALPFLSLRLGNSDAGNDPKASTTRQAYDLLAHGFGPGFNGPLQLTAEVASPSDKATFDQVVTAASIDRDVASVSPARVLGPQGHQVALAQVYPASAPQDAATVSLINRLRHDVIPTADSARSPAVLVGGTTAIFIDFARVLTSKLPLFIAVVVVLSFLLLASVFRSVAVPITAAIMNLVSAAAAFGILTAVFQWGWLGSVFGVNRNGPIEAFLPVMLFAILFGLSMDYEVFLISRIHEEWLHRGDNTAAVTAGLDATGRTITAAAAIMVLVFGAFLLGGLRVIKEFGLGLAGAIAVDAIVVRSAVVPAVMLALGRANWWFPKSLDRILPRLAVEPPEESIVEGAHPNPDAEVPVESLL